MSPVGVTGSADNAVVPPNPAVILSLSCTNLKPAVHGVHQLLVVLSGHQNNTVILNHRAFEPCLWPFKVSVDAVPRSDHVVVVDMEGCRVKLATRLLNANGDAVGVHLDVVSLIAVVVDV